MSARLRSRRIAATVSVLMLNLSSNAWADDFISECQKGTSAADPLKVCTCMSS
jgi:hypothetical protein